jgi:RNA polymerase sigma factor (sigma-70 family)
VPFGLRSDEIFSRRVPRIILNGSVSGVSHADVELLEAWRAGDSEAGSELFDRHFETLARFFANKVGDGLDDLVQQTFLACVEARDRFRGDAKFRTYLLGIAHNVLCKHYRRRYASPDFSLGTTAVADLAPTASSLLAQHREQELLLQALRSLPFDHQVVLELHYWERMPSSDIKDVLGIPEGTIKTRLRRAKQLLREALETLAQSPAELERTSTDLEAWARSIAAMLSGRD